MNKYIQYEKYKLEIVFDVFDIKDIDDKQKLTLQNIENNIEQIMSVAIMQIQNYFNIQDPKPIAIYICKDRLEKNIRKSAVIFEMVDDMEEHPCAIFENEQFSIVGYDSLIL
ncbi:MAG: hypothetical protein ACI4IH_02380 [Eubacterium sp.]